MDTSDNSSEEKDGSKSPDDDYDFSIELKGPSSFSEEEFEDELSLEKKLSKRVNKDQSYSLKNNTFVSKFISKSQIQT